MVIFIRKLVVAGARIGERRGCNIATVPVARKLLTLVYGLGKPGFRSLWLNDHQNLGAEQQRFTCVTGGPCVYMLSPMSDLR
ncbi:hypothetical protein [Micromonospora sp. NPDC048830]|uniref:hypothetical protein n=1 Tax=Micromonospora sp. NPDC048830 TaxID=3364257 RepID=UPI0037157E7E